MAKKPVPLKIDETTIVQSFIERSASELNRLQEAIDPFFTDSVLQDLIINLVQKMQAMEAAEIMKETNEISNILTKKMNFLKEQYKKQGLKLSKLDLALLLLMAELEDNRAKSQKEALNTLLAWSILANNNK